MRKLVLSLAMSIDGYILDEEGGFEWITGDGDSTLDTKEKFDFDVFLGKMDTVVMGRVSYEDATMEFFKDHRVIVATSRNMEDHDNIEFIKDDIVGFVSKLMKEDGKDIFLYGGSILVDYFMKADIIDEFVIAVVPMVIGKGKLLFLGNNPSVKLHLDRYTVKEGMTIVEYSRR